MDEFSDFQMAVQQQPTPTGNKGPLGKISKFPDSSPVHSLQGHSSTKSDLVLRSHKFSLPTSLKPAVPPVPKNTRGGNVGSRLANYDLGLSFPNFGGPVQVNGNGVQNGTNGMELSTGMMSTHFKTISNPPYARNYNQDLLIGEEDKYSALRMFMETDVNNTGSIFENSRDDSTLVSSPPSNTLGQSIPSVFNSTTPPVTSQEVPVNSLNSNYANSNGISALEFSSPNFNSSSKVASCGTGTVESSSDFGDFGDFQSFTGFTTPIATKADYKCNVKTTSIPQSFETHTNDIFQNVEPSPIPQVSLPKFQTGFTMGSIPEPPAPPVTVDSGTCDSDGEFGDFVSVEPVPAPSVPSTSTISSYSANKNNTHFDLFPNTTIGPFSVLSTPPPFPGAEEEKKLNQSVGGLLGIDDLLNAATPPDLESYHSAQPQSNQAHLPTVPNSHQSVDTGFDTFSDFATGLTLKTNMMDAADFTSPSCESLTRKGSSSSSSGLGLDTPHQQFQSPPPIPSTFIRTSLIRNDEVTDIDPLKWNHSLEESNNDPGLDYVPFDRKDPGGKSKFLDISPETRSIASLDLGNYVTVDYSEAASNLNNNNNNNNNSKTFVDQTVALQNNSHASNGKIAPSLTPPAPLHHSGLMSSADEAIIYDEYDKYQCFREECENEKERYVTEWTRCLLACKVLISNAFAVFNGASTSEVIKEVVADEKGYSYVMNVLEVYRVFQQIQKSAERIGLQIKLRGVCAEITYLWESLTAFLLGTCVSTDICQDQSSCTDYVESFSLGEKDCSSCGVCLHPVNTSLASQYLDYGGKMYHCTCANFWVNEVDTILPSLSSYLSTVENNGRSSNTNCGMDYVQNEHQDLSKYDKASGSLV